jgi:hypothetical protein
MRIINNNYREPYNNVVIVETFTTRRGNDQRRHNNPLSGLRESCEDLICSECTLFADASSYKRCKEKCFDENEDEITTCCKNQCPDSNIVCNESCARLRYVDNPDAPIRL